MKTERPNGGGGLLILLCASLLLVAFAATMFLFWVPHWLAERRSAANRKWIVSINGTMLTNWGTSWTVSMEQPPGGIATNPEQALADYRKANFEMGVLLGARHAMILFQETMHSGEVVPNPQGIVLARSWQEYTNPAPPRASVWTNNHMYGDAGVWMEMTK